MSLNCNNNNKPSTCNDETSISQVILCIVFVILCFICMMFLISNADNNYKIKEKNRLEKISSSLNETHSTGKIVYLKTIFQQIREIEFGEILYEYEEMEKNAKRTEIETTKGFYVVRGTVSALKNAKTWKYGNYLWIDYNTHKERYKIIK